jgi:Permeases of the drug/metabolite transporter (DMT) superfamily
MQYMRFFWRTPVLFILLGTIWGSSFLAIDVGLQVAPPLTFAAFRYLLAGILLVGYSAYRTGRWVPRSGRAVTEIGIIAVFLIAAYHALLYTGQVTVAAPVAAVLVNLSPIFTAIIAVLWMGQRYDSAAIAGFIVGLIGVAIVAISPGVGLRVDGIGMVLIIGAGLSFAVGSLLTSVRTDDTPLVTIHGWGMLVGAGVLFVAAVVGKQPLMPTSWGPSGLIALVYLAIASSIFGFLMFFELLTRMPTAELNLIGYIQPIAAAMLGWVIFGHSVAPTTVVGFAVIVIGFLLVHHTSVETVLAAHRRRFTLREPVSIYAVDPIEATDAQSTKVGSSRALADTAD